MFEIIIADVIVKYLPLSKVPREIIDEHLIMPKVLKSFYVFEHFPEDHWIIVVEMMDKNPNPNKDFHSIRSILKSKITLNARCKRSTA